jgi:hypothetical protein
MGRAQWSAKWFFERESSPASHCREVAAGSYRHIPSLLGVGGLGIHQWLTQSAQRNLHAMLYTLYAQGGNWRDHNELDAAPHIPFPKMLDCIGTGRVDSKSACNRTIQLSML